jgi:hypothetical protein
MSTTKAHICFDMLISSSDEDAMTAEQIQNVIEYIPTREERKASEAHML